MFVAPAARLRPGEEVPARAPRPRRTRGDVRRRLQLPLERPGLRRARLRRGDGELPRLVELRPALRRVDPRGAPRQAASPTSMRATDLLVAEGHVDPSRMAAAGGSYGGFLVNWIAGPHRPLQGPREPRGRLRPARPVRLRLDLRPPALLRRLPLHEPRRTSRSGARTAMPPASSRPCWSSTESATSACPWRRASSSTAPSPPKACPRGSSTTPTRTTGS